MNVQIEKITAVYPAFFSDENASMSAVNDLLGRFINELGNPDEMILVSQATGEVISVDEIRCARGVLDALYRTCVWRVEE